MNFLHGGLTHNVDVMVDEVLRRMVCDKPKSRPGHELLDIAGWAVSHFLLALNARWIPDTKAASSPSGGASKTGVVTICPGVQFSDPKCGSTLGGAEFTAVQAALQHAGAVAPFGLFGSADTTNSTALFSSTLLCRAVTRVGNLIVMHKGSASGFVCCRVSCYATDAHQRGFVVGHVLPVLVVEHGYLVVDDGGGGVVAAFVVDPALLLEHCASTQHGHLPDTQLVLMPTDSLPFWLLNPTLIGEINAKHDSASSAAASGAASATGARY
jgi:hypothetical protein